MLHFLKGFVFYVFCYTLAYCVNDFKFPIELSRDITEISPLWELLPFNLS